MNKLNELLRHHVSGAIERGESEAIAGIPELFGNIERLMDRHGIQTFADTAANVCREKSEHVLCNWQDKTLAKSWELLAGEFDGVTVAANLYGIE